MRHFLRNLAMILLFAGIGAFVGVQLNVGIDFIQDSGWSNFTTNQQVVFCSYAAIVLGSFLMILYSLFTMFS